MGVRRRAPAAWAAVAVICGLFVTVGLAGQGTAKSTRDGVYTKEQAARGATQYAKVCASCHDPAKVPAGKKAAPQLIGDKFLDKWRDRTLGELLTLIETTMPDDGSAVLNSAETADVVASILQANGFPAGASALASKDKDVVIK